MLPQVKHFIEQNIELIESNRFYELYKKASDDLYFSQTIATLTRALIQANIDPLAHMNEVPYCFLYGDSTLKKFNIPDNIEFVSMVAFAECTSLEEITCGSKVSVIYYGAFEECTSLTNVHLNEGLLEIGRHAFRNTNIEKIRLPSTVRSIDNQAFPELVTMEVFPGTYAHEWAVTNGYEVELVY